MCCTAFYNYLSIHFFYWKLIEEYFYYYFRYPGNLTILNCNLKIVLLLTQHISLCKFDICKQTVNSIVSFLWSHLDHSVNVIRQMAKDSLHNLISQKGLYLYFTSEFSNICTSLCVREKWTSFVSFVFYSLNYKIFCFRQWRSNESFKFSTAEQRIRSSNMYHYFIVEFISECKSHLVLS